MARILVMSSWVAHGHVGLSAAVPVLQALGHGVTQLPTVLLSNHPGWPRVAGRQVPPDEIVAMVAALDANGWLTACDTLLTGYLPSPGHVDLACSLIERLRQEKRDLRIIVDPVLGDRPKGLYIAQEAAHAIRERLAHLADVLTPNAFELAWLSGSDTTTPDEAMAAAEILHARTSGAEILVTSPPISEAETGILAVGAKGRHLYRSPKADHALVPHGAGDVLSALIAAGLSVGAALGHLETLVSASLGAQHLRIAESAADWTMAAPRAAERIDLRPQNAAK